MRCTYDTLADVWYWTMILPHLGLADVGAQVLLPGSSGHHQHSGGLVRRGQPDRWVAMAWWRRLEVGVFPGSGRADI